MISAKAALAISAILLSFPVAAQPIAPPLPIPNPITEEEISKLQPSEENKVWFLKRGYQLNGDSMVRWGSIDAEDLPVVVRPTIMHPVDKWTDKNALDKAADRVGRSAAETDVPVAERNICTLHHMRKVFTADGSSWRCRK